MLICPVQCAIRLSTRLFIAAQIKVHILHVRSSENNVVKACYMLHDFHFLTR